MYEKLLLEKDGGIIDLMAQSEQDNCAVLCIGLGGTGVDCLRVVKAKVYNRIKPDDAESSVPSYKSIRFLAMDTDKGGLQRANEKSSDISKVNLDTEFFDLSMQGNISKLLKAGAGKLSRDPNYKEWLRYDDIDVSTANSGAGGVRMLGRYLLSIKAGEFVDRVRSLVKQAKEPKDRPKVYVHIFTGMGGGTGAGTFLDVCYLVKHALDTEGTEVKTCGYFFLPDINLSKPEIDPQTKAYIMVNGYGSLQSLDYCMNFEYNGDQWSQRYAGVGLVEKTEPPVDIAHLITAQDSHGNVIANAYQYSMNVVTEYFMNYLMKVDNEDFTLASVISNFESNKAEVRKYHGARYEYLVIGASSATLPYKEILTYLAAALFAKFAGIEKNLPTPSQLEEFINANQLEYPALRSQITQGCNLVFPNPDWKWKDVHNNANDVVADHFHRCRTNALNQLEANFSEMSRDLEGYHIVSGGDKRAARSVITKIFNAVHGVVTNPMQGPFYAAALVRGVTGRDLIASIDGHIEQVVKDITYERSTSLRGGGTLADEFSARQSQFFAKGSKKNYEEYLGIARLYQLTETRIEVLEKLHVFLKTLRKQLVSFADSFTDPLRNTIDSLIKTFQKNLVYLNDLRKTTVSYEYPLFTIQDIRESLDLTISEMDRDAKITDFMNLMISDEGVAAWQGTQDNDKIARVVTKFFTTLFQSYSNKTMTQYLHEKYRTAGDTIKLIQSIRDDALETLDSKATPLFWQSSDAADESPSKIGHITVPDHCSEVSEASKKLIEKQRELKLRETGIKDRITIVRFQVGVPLFCYQGCLQYETNYVASNKVGKQPYEGKEFVDDAGEIVRGRDWRLLPSVVPFSVMNNANSPALLNQAKEAKELYKRAVETGVIEKVAVDYVLRVLSGAYLANVQAIYSKAKDGDVGEKLEAQEKIKALLATRDFDPNSPKILNDAKDTDAEVTEAIKEQVRIDHFIAAPQLQSLAQQQLALLEQIKGWIVELTPIIDTDLPDYTNALFTGAIAFDPPVIKTENDYGEVTELSTPESTFGAIPLYQGFLSYKALPERARKQIAEMGTAARKTAASSVEVKEAIASIQEELDFKKDFLATARQDFPTEYVAIRNFLDDIEGKLKTFIRSYRINLG